MLNGSPLNTTVIGGASSSVRIVTLISTTVQRVVASLSCSIDKVLSSSIVMRVLGSVLLSRSIPLSASGISQVSGTVVLTVNRSLPLTGVCRPACRAAVGMAVDRMLSADSVSRAAGVVKLSTEHLLAIAATATCRVVSTASLDDMYAGDVPEDFVTMVPAGRLVTPVPPTR